MFLAYSVSIPAVDSGCARLDIPPVGDGQSESTVCVLALPRRAAQEVCDLFKMAQLQAGNGYIKDSHPLDPLDRVRDH